MILQPGQDTNRRLLIAFALSVLLHLALLLGMPVNPTGGVPSVTSTITARLESALTGSVETQAPSISGVSDGTTDLTAQAGPDVLPDSANKPREVRSESAPAAPPPSTPSTGLEIPLIRDPTFYPAAQLEVYPAPLSAIQLVYPEAAVSARVEGNLLLLLLIDEFGVVSEISVLEATPAGYFEEAARSVLRAVRFSPGIRNGVPVKSRMPFRLRYTYDMTSGSGN